MADRKPLGLDRDDPNVRVMCSSCLKGEHMCGGDCDCIRCFMERMGRGAS